MAGDPSPEPCVVLTLTEAWRMRGHLKSVERRNGQSLFDERLYDCITILEKAMGMPPKREMLTAYQWDATHPGEDFNFTEIEWRGKMREAYLRWDPMEKG